MRERTEEIAENIATFDENVADTIFTSIAAEISNRETDLKGFTITKM